MTTQNLSHRQVASLIKALGHTRTVIVQGEAGSGKTSLLYELRADPMFAGFYSPGPVDCTQLSDGSVFMPDIDRSRGVARELPNERFGLSEENHRGVKGAMPALICLDEIAKTRQFIKDTLAPILYERRIGDLYYPEKSVVFGCTNLSDEGLGDSMQAHLRNRIVLVTMRKPTKEEWVTDFAVPRTLHESVIAAAEQHPNVFDSFLDYRAGGKFASQNRAKHNPYIADPTDAMQEQVVTPRSLHAASDVVATRGQIDDMTMQAALAGAVGAPFAAVIMSMIRFGDQLPAYERVIADPAGAPIATNPTAQIVQCFQFVTQAKDRDEAELLSQYVMRMRAEMKSLFVSTISHSSRLDVFAMSATFGKMLTEYRNFLGA